ncbi:hypothetical protein [Klebsiella pneumoniae]|uniref:hypothetical protein n=1 Tax=Klebsiella pneumoniae TaxID=573 RepID=UPI002264BFCF|nr:hypothetical protein [Klebsiella pneumoniae]MCX8314999.1 hypothetical protein [Klebsiella pneumoniae]MDE1128727.1 hypothetical protein [Klebsiella pneumoniae]
MTKSTITRERLEQLADNNTICKVSWDERIELAQIALAAMDSESGCLPLDYLQWHKDGLEWAAQLAEANHPETGDWLYDDPIELAKAIRKGPDMPPAQPAADSEPVAWTWHYREQWHVTNDSRRAEFVAKDGDVAVLPLYRHAQSAQISEPVLPLQDKDLQGVIDALEHPAGINAAGKQVVRHALVEIQERRKADSEPVAEVVSIYGDPEAFGEREIRPLVGIQQMPYGTKLYRHAQPAPVVSTDLFHTAASAIEDLLTTKDRAGAGVWFDLPFRLRSAANAQPAPVVPDDLSIFEAAIEECKKCDSIDEHAWNHGVLAVIAEYESCRAAMLAAAPQEVKGE